MSVLASLLWLLSYTLCIYLKWSRMAECCGIKDIYGKDVRFFWWTSSALNLRLQKFATKKLVPSGRKHLDYHVSWSIRLILKFSVLVKGRTMIWAGWKPPRNLKKDFNKNISTPFSSALELLKKNVRISYILRREEYMVSLLHLSLLNISRFPNLLLDQIRW